MIRAIDRVNRGPGQKIIYRCEGATGSLVGFLTPLPRPFPPLLSELLDRRGGRGGEAGVGGEVEKP